ncbi:MAG: hypothetical protein STHCBS139747_006789 [Sporothrix thermara]
MAQSVDDAPRNSQDEFATTRINEPAAGAGTHPDMMATGRGSHLSSHYHNNDGQDHSTDSHSHSSGHSHRSGNIASIGLGTAAGGAAGMAGGEHDVQPSHRNGLHHTRGGNIGGGPEMVGSGMTGDAGMVSPPAQIKVDKLAAEENNNFPGTNPHPAHSALDMRDGHGRGLAFPGRD